MVDKGAFEILVAAGVEHTDEAAPLRAGCDISMLHQQEIEAMVETGTKPGVIYSTLTNREKVRCQSLHIAPAKRPEGGLQGTVDAN